MNAITYHDLIASPEEQLQRKAVEKEQEQNLEINNRQRTAWANSIDSQKYIKELEDIAIKNILNVVDQSLNNQISDAQLRLMLVEANTQRKLVTKLKYG